MDLKAELQAESVKKPASQMSMSEHWKELVVSLLAEHASEEDIMIAKHSFVSGGIAALVRARTEPKQVYEELLSLNHEAAEGVV